MIGLFPTSPAKIIAHFSNDVTGICSTRNVEMDLVMSKSNENEFHPIICISQSLTQDFSRKLFTPHLVVNILVSPFRVFEVSRIGDDTGLLETYSPFPAAW